MRPDFFKLFAAACVIVMAASGCATLQKGSHQRIPIETRPEGATVYVNHERVGTTPVEIPLLRRTGHIVEITKRGFDSHRAILRPVPNERDGAFIQFSTDNYTGALNNLSPSRIRIQLRPVLLPARPGEDPEAEKEAKLAEAESIRRSGGFSAEDYEYVVDRIERFYESAER